MYSVRYINAGQSGLVWPLALCELGGARSIILLKLETWEGDSVLCFGSLPPSSDWSFFLRLAKAPLVPVTLIKSSGGRAKKEACTPNGPQAILVCFSPRPLPTVELARGTEYEG